MRVPWAAAHAAAKADRERLEALERRSDWTVEERLEHAGLVACLRPEYDAALLYERALELVPENANAHFRAGVLRIEGDDAAGAAHLRQAITRDAGAVRPVFEKLDAWARDGTLSAAVAEALAALRGEFAAKAASLAAREGVDDDDDLVAHDLDPAAMQALQAALAPFGQIGAAWLARKRLDMAGEPPHYALLVTWRGSVVSETAGLKRVVDALRLPGSVSVFTESAHRAEARRVRAACPDPVYRRAS
jgi:hypothetical protein